MGSYFLIFLSLFLISCDGTNSTTQSIYGNQNMPVGAPDQMGGAQGMSAGNGRLDAGAKGMLSQFNFTAFASSGKSLLDYSGQARLQGTLAFGNVYSARQTLQMGAHTTAYSGQQCPQLNIPYKFNCQAEISAGNFLCRSVRVGLHTYHIKGSLMRSSTPSTHAYDVIAIFVYGPCALRSGLSF